MRLYTPESLLYPITVLRIHQQPGDDISQNAPLFTYEYKSATKEWDEEVGEDVEKIRSLYADFECELEGSITSIAVKKGQVINGRTQVADIDETCRHEVQYGGICANCGKDMTTVQYNSTTKNTARATVNTVHGHTKLLVSETQASLADEEAKRRLLDAEKLILVVDLDQTIIHATVDPTVAEWQKDPSNPNYDAVKDVRAFQLMDDGPGARGCWYYIKLRPGLETFLETISQSYELHIYTMGTRAYAENIAKIIDPMRNIFGERILSRNESGSMTAKNLKRLFPVDTKMVIIIDDRGDVWQWSQNLVKVNPYDFFVGIGDINSSFLPKRPELEASPPSAPPKPAVTATEDQSNGTKTSEGLGQSNGEVSTVDHMVSMAGKQDEGSMQEKVEEQDEQIAAQVQDRPLMQKQLILDKAEEEAQASPAVVAAAELLADDSEAIVSSPSIPKYRHNLLQDDDNELEYLGRSLRSVHQAYFRELERQSRGTKGGRIADLRPGSSKKRSAEEIEHIPDAAQIMAGMKAKVLQGVHLVFSGVLPVGGDVQRHDICIWAKSFGATISENITKSTTHVIASPERRTAKVRNAAKRPRRIAIVSQGWLLACFSQWKKVREEPYRIHHDAPTNGANTLPDSFENKDEQRLSSSEDDDGLTGGESEFDTPAPSSLRIETRADEESAEDLSEHMPSLDRADSSPTENENPDDWLELNKELDDWLGSDADDDSDNESVRSELSTRSELKTPPSAVKRKREAEMEEANGSMAEAGQIEESRLQKRKKEALARTSSLTAIATVAPEERSSLLADDIGGTEQDDDLEALLAAEFAAEDE